MAATTTVLCLSPIQAQATTFRAANALVLARLCQAAYSDDATARAAALQLGFTGFQWIDLTEQFEDVYAIAAATSDCVVLAFRGTKDFKNWMSDLKATPTSFSWLFEGGPSVGDVHAGFGHAVRDAWNQIRDAIDLLGSANSPAAEESPKPLWITGHSLGGALAIVTGAAFSMWSGAPLRSVSGIYTFGQPRIGLFPFCGSYDHLLQAKTFRFINNRDLVPRVPFRGWDYADIGEMIHFDSSSVPERNSVQWSNFLSRSLESFEEFFSMVGNLNVDVGDHSMDGYAALVEKQQVALDKLFE